MSPIPVSYTHLDVYKRQGAGNASGQTATAKVYIDPAPPNVPGVTLSTEQWTNSTVTVSYTHLITEEAVKLAGLGAKNLAAILVALAKEEEKTHGPTRLTRLLRSGEELKLLPIKSEDLRQFRRLAKEYGILFCPIKNKSLDNGLKMCIRDRVWTHRTSF